ncbi:hypothetical protein DMP14_11245 [Pseudonocardia sp. Ae707_Ps2]
MIETVMAWTSVDPGDDPAWIEHRRRREAVEEATRCPHGLAADLCGEMCGPEQPPDPSGGIDDVAWAALRCLVAGALPDRLTDLQVLDVLEGAEHWVRRSTALRMRSVAEVAERHPTRTSAAPPGADPRASQPVARWLPDQVAIVLRVPRDHARSLIGQAQRFARVLPETLAEWESGRIDQAAAEAISSSTLVLDDERARRVQAAVLPGAPQRTGGCSGSGCAATSPGSARTAPASVTNGPVRSGGCRSPRGTTAWGRCGWAAPPRRSRRRGSASTGSRVPSTTRATTGPWTRSASTSPTSCCRAR